MSSVDAGSLPSVSVITLTRGRPATLIRAMSSVASQAGVAVEHIVVADRCPFVAQQRLRDELRERFPHAVLVDVTELARTFDYLPARLAHLRNLSVARASGNFIAHLDDDNVYQPGHLASLTLALRRTPGADVAHSWRRLLWPDGTPFVPAGEDPWDIKPWRRARTYRRAQRLGIYTPGSCVVRDALEIDGRAVARVDTSELMLTRALHAEIPFPTEFRPEERKRRVGDDAKLCSEVVARGVGHVCTRRATLDYYMGGYSNRHQLSGRAAGPVAGGAP